MFSQTWAWPSGERNEGNDEGVQWQVLKISL